MAFLLVFFHHRPGLNSGILEILHEKGWFGVEVFFVLSAFLLTRLLKLELENTQGLCFKNFYLRRILRIWPPYYLMIALSLLVYFFVDKRNWQDLEGYRLAGLLSFSDNVVTALHDYNSLPCVTHLWTISYEEQFYLLLPVLLLFLHKLNPLWRWIFMGMMFLLGSAIRFFGIAEGFSEVAVWTLPFTHFESILAGLGMGLAYSGKAVKQTKGWIFLLAAIISLYILIAFPGVEMISQLLFFTYLFTGLSSAFTLLAVLHHPVLKFIFSHPVLVFLGKRSYGLYLYHMLGNVFAGYLVVLYPATNVWEHAGLFYSLAFTTVAAILSYRFLEKPFLEYKTKLELVPSRPY